jgi:hypothetical protein
MRWLAATAGALAVAALGLIAGGRQQGTVPEAGGGPSARDSGTAPPAEAAPASDAGSVGASTAPEPDAGPRRPVAGQDAGTARQDSPRGRAPPRGRSSEVDYVGDPPDRLTIDPQPDGGQTTPADAGTNQRAQQDELRRRIDLLEQQLAASRDQTAELQQMNEQLAALRQQLAESEQAREEAQRQAQLQKVEARQATSTLYRVQQTLAAGNGNVLDALSSVEPSLPAPAQREVQAARAALAGGDLFQARVHVAAAIAAAQGEGN